MSIVTTLPEPDACVVCRHPREGHGNRVYTPTKMLHEWVAPSEQQIRDRTTAARIMAAARHRG